MVDPAQSDLYKNIPLGDNVAREFPWWRELTLTQPTSVAYREQRFVVGPNNAPLRADRERPIKIHELRFMMNANAETHPLDWAKFSSIQVQHSKYDVVSKWLPLNVMNTEDNRLMQGDQFSAVWRLPAPYFLQRGQAFKMELVPINAELVNTTIHICLRGWDPENQTPCVMSKEVDTAQVLNGRTDVAFDEDRDAALRNMWIHDICFGYMDLNAASTAFSFNSSLRVRFKPGMGPKWTREDSAGTILAGLTLYESGVDANGDERPMVIHRPVTPYVLNGRDTMTIKYRNDNATRGENTFYCWAVGTQEGRY